MLNLRYSRVKTKGVDIIQIKRGKQITAYKLKMMLMAKNEVIPTFEQNKRTV